MKKHMKLSDDAIRLFRRLDKMIDIEGGWDFGERIAIEEIQKAFDKYLMDHKEN